MPAYRIYLRTREGHILGPAMVVDCADDQEATQKAAQVVDGGPVEIWESARFVARLPREDRP